MRGKTVTVKEIQKLDEIAISRYHIPSLYLMEQAGRAVAEEVWQSVRRVADPKVVIVCGLGNNAGDGLVVARQLINKNIRTDVIVVGKTGQLKKDASVNYALLRRLTDAIITVKKVNPAVTRFLRDSDCIVDAIFGVGLNREIREPFRAFIRQINRLKKMVVSVDIPSGLDGTSGEIYGVCVRASKTVTFTYAKSGFYNRKGSRYTGQVIVVDIGIPANAKKKEL
jgi:hydroxyethylthiazole kinase-like uncharacterized protein yjeF